MQALWLFNCGIHTWYTQEGRLGGKYIFEACSKKAAEWNVDFEEIVYKLTPEWLTIVQHELNSSKIMSQPDDFTKRFDEEKQQIHVEYGEMSYNEILQSLPQTAYLSNATERFRTISKRIEQEQKLNHDNAVYMIENMCPYLADKTWRYEGFEDILKPLIAASNREGFWLLAKIIGQNLSEYNYQIDRFLEFIEEWYDYPHMNDDLRICIKRSGCKENYGVDNFQKIGDCLLPAAIDEEDRILYSAEKDGRWVEIPLLQKKCWLLPSDDPYLLTEMPHMVFDDSWFPCISDSYGEKSDIRINKDQFSKIVHGNRPVGEIVLGACVWYPWNDDDGKLYIETAKIDTNTLSPYRSDKVDPCFGNYGLLAHEGALVEFGGDFAHINGASLFKVVGGNMFFYLCNSQIAPSEIWREGFKCVPDHTSPYCWRDENGNIVLRFERIASPIREAMHEKYYRQPILFRWLCNSEWLKETLCKHNLHLRYVSRLESIP